MHDFIRAAHGVTAIMCTGAGSNGPGRASSCAAESVREMRTMAETSAQVARRRVAGTESGAEPQKSGSEPQKRAPEKVTSTTHVNVALPFAKLEVHEPSEHLVALTNLVQDLVELVARTTPGGRGRCARRPCTSVGGQAPLIGRSPGADQDRRRAPTPRLVWRVGLEYTTSPPPPMMIRAGGWRRAQPLPIRASLEFARLCVPGSAWKWPGHTASHEDHSRFDLR